MEKEKRYTITIITTPKVIQGCGKLLSACTREVLRSIFKMDRAELKWVLSRIPNCEVAAFWENGIRKAVVVDKTIHRRWHAIPKSYKNHVKYLVNQMLEEKLYEIL
ncbi:MAG: hypothetical protein RXR65_07280 [Hydrogenobaculum sp.]|jgi:hypothetical protein